MDAIAVGSLVAAVLSLTAGAFAVYYSRDAALSGRKALDLAEKQAAIGPHLEVMLLDDPCVIIKPTPIKQPPVAK